MNMLTDTGKDGYDRKEMFRERTARALAGDRGLHDIDIAHGVASLIGEWWAFTLIAPHIAQRPQYRVLELGCGFGRNAPFLSMFDCARYVGVDEESRRIAYAKERFQSGLVRFEEADALTYRGEEPFDVIAIVHVLMHMVRPNKFRLIETCKANLAPGGVVILREGDIVDVSPAEADEHYRLKRPYHCIPVAFSELVSAFAPLVLRHVFGAVYVAEE